jgi:predicted permease
MPDWKQQLETRLAGQRIEPARAAGIVEEMSQHLQDRYEELLSAGTPESEARRQVLEELESSDRFVAELPSSLRRPAQHLPPQAELPSGNLALDLLRDLRFGLRGMLRAPGFSFFAILTLALGIGASTTVFTLVNTLLLHPLPAHNPSRLVCLYTTDVKGQKQSGNLLPTSYLNLKDYQARNTSLSALGGFSPPLVLTLTQGEGTERFFGQLVTSNYFETLGLAPAAGRFFLPSETSTPGGMPVAILSYSAWKVRFNHAPDIMGKTLQFNGTPFTIVGVAPQGFLGVSAVFGPDVWLPATMAAQVLPPPMQDILRERGKAFFQAVARLKPDVTRSQAEQNLQAIASSLQREYPDVNTAHTASVQPVTTALFSNTGGEAGLAFVSAVLLGIVGLVLLIACSNVANLLMARAVDRRQEIAVRLSIGASRGRLLRQLLSESMLLGIFGGVGGLFVGYQGCGFLWSFRPPDVARNLVDPRLDTTVYLFALLLSLATAFIFGVVPSLKASRTDLVDGLKQEAHLAAPTGRSGRFQRALLTAQVAFSLVSLIAASLFLRAVQRAYTIDPGFDENHLAVFMMNPEQVGYDAARLEAFHRDVRERVAAIPGIEAVSWASNMPFWASPSRGVQIEGQQQTRKSDALNTVTNTVDVGYFWVMGIPLVQGRTFTAADRDGSLPVVVINEDLARRYWPHGDALGKRLQLVGENTMRQIVGVVKNSDYTTLGEASQPCLFFPLLQNPGGNVTLYVRAANDPASVLGEVQREIRELAPRVQISDIRTGSKLMDQILWSARIVLSLLGIFGLLALTLASVGLYGLLAYSVRGRQREIGVRMALGASRSAVLRLVLQQGMILVAVGVTIGLALSLLIGRLFSRMLFGVSPADPMALIGASAILLLVAFLATYIPALTASRMEPMRALREG